MTGAMAARPGLGNLVRAARRNTRATRTAMGQSPDRAR